MGEQKRYDRWMAKAVSPGGELYNEDGSWRTPSRIEVWKARADLATERERELVEALECIHKKADNICERLKPKLRGPEAVAFWEASDIRKQAGAILAKHKEPTK